MRRLLKIILILVLVLGIIFVVTWMLSRNKAVKEGGTAPSFREFIVGDRPRREQNQEGGGDQLTPDEQQDETVAEEDDQQDTSITVPDIGTIEVSQFTSGPLVPSESMVGSLPIGTGATPQSGGVSVGTTSNPTTPPVVSPTSSPGPVCSDDDLTIAFTAEEIRRLGELQDEFTSIANTLRTDADVQAELANYTVFKTKADATTELYNYCLAVSPRITDPILKARIATPFWRDPARDVQGYIHPRTVRASDFLFQQGSTNSNPIDPRNVTSTQSILERYFKLNLW